jgi:hypothetical protein
MGISTCIQVYFPSNMVLVTLRHYTFQHSFINYYNPFARTKIVFIVIKYYITVIQFKFNLTKIHAEIAIF